MIYLLLPLYAIAGVSILNVAPDYDLKRVKTKKITKARVVNKKSKTDKLLEDIQKSDEALTLYLENDSKKLIVSKSNSHIPPLTRLRGTLLNSIIATNSRATKLVIELKPNDYFNEAELLCHGVSFGKRVISKCDLLVSHGQTYKLSSELWDIDGAEGLIADEFYDGAEKEFLTSSFASFFEGVLDGTRDRVVTPFGESTRVNSKNQVMSGLMNIANNANQKIKNSSEKNLQIALVRANKEVIVFLNKELALEEKR